MEQAQVCEEIMARMEGLVKDLVGDCANVDAGAVLDEIERKVFDGSSKIMGVMVERLVSAHRRGRQEPRPDCACGRIRRRGLRAKGLLTRFGWMAYRRVYWHCDACGATVFPEDDWLGIEADGVSLMMRDLISFSGTLEAFGPAAATLAKLTGVRVDAKRVERLTSEVGQDLSVRYDTGRSMGISGSIRGRLYVEVDANKVHTRESGWRDVRNAVLHDGEGSGPVTYLADLERYEAFGLKVRREAGALGLRETSQVVFIADGLPANWTLARVNFPGALEVLDFYHAAEHIWKCARTLYGETGQNTRKWARRWVDRLKKAGPARLMRMLAARKGRTKEEHKRQALQDLLRYVRSNRCRMDYPAYKAAGVRIGSGRVESACKSVTGSRLKGPGMRWKQANVRAMAHNRAVLKSGLWERYWALRRAEKITAYHEAA